MPRERRVGSSPSSPTTPGHPSPSPGSARPASTATARPPTARRGERFENGSPDCSLLASRIAEERVASRCSALPASSGTSAGPRPVGRRTTPADLYFPGNAGHHHPSPQQLARPRDRAPAGAPEPLSRRRGSAALAPHARPRLSPRQGAAADARAHARPGRRPRRGRRAPGRRCLPRGARRAVDPAADERERRDRPGRGGQAGHLQGDGPGPPGRRARRLQELQLHSPRSRSSTTPGSTRSSTSCATSTRRWRRSRTVARRTATTR